MQGQRLVTRLWKYESCDAEINHQTVEKSRILVKKCIFMDIHQVYSNKIFIEKISHKMTGKKKLFRSFLLPSLPHTPLKFWLSSCIKKLDLCLPVPRVSWSLLWELFKSHIFCMEILFLEGGWFLFYSALCCFGREPMGLKSTAKLQVVTELLCAFI